MTMRTVSTIWVKAAKLSPHNDANSLHHTAQIEKLNRCYQDIMRKIARGTATAMMHHKATALDLRIKSLQDALTAGKIAPRVERGVARMPSDPTRKHGRIHHDDTTWSEPLPQPKLDIAPPKFVTVKAGRGNVKRVLAKPSVPVEAKPWALVKIGRGYRAKKRNEHVTKPESTANGKPTVSVSEDDSFK